MMSDMEKSELTFAEPVDWSALTETERDEVLKRPAVAAGARITEVVTGILADVEKRGDEALRELSAKFDRGSGLEPRDAGISLGPANGGGQHSALSHCGKTGAGDGGNDAGGDLHAGDASYRQRRSLHPRRYGAAFFHRADAGDPRVDRGLQ